MFTVKILPRAEDQLRKIQKNIQIKIVEIIDTLEFTYYPNKYDISKLKGYGHTYRVRIGIYRILYFVDFHNKEITILSIMSRKKAYKKR